MKQFLTTLSLLITVFSINFDSKAAIITAIASGNWNSPFTWSAGIPVCGDTVDIPFGTSVTVTVNVDLDNGDPLCPFFRLSIGGHLKFDNGKKMHFATGACVTVEVGGKVGPSSKGGGGSESIYVGPDRVWQASDGLLLGQASLGCAVMLPVTLLNFYVLQTGNELVFHWKVASETNVEKYVIEYSEDGKTWNVLDEKEASGNSTEYEYDLSIRTSGIQNLTYYKLMNFDMNSKKTVLDIISFYPENFVEDGKLMLIPNPVEKNSLLSIQYNTDSQIETSIQIIDQRGVILFNKSVIESTRDGEFIFDTSVLKSGTYFVNLTNKNQSLKSKLAVL